MNWNWSGFGIGISHLATPALSTAIQTYKTCDAQPALSGLYFDRVD